LVEEISHIPMIFIAAGSFSASISKKNRQVYFWGTGTFGEFKSPYRVKKLSEKEAKIISIGNNFGIVLT
jgi:hypothetical protein